MAKYGLLVDAQWCSGCHSCEIACQMEPGNMEYRQALSMMQQGGYGYNTNMTGGQCDSLDCCTTMLCLNCLCGGCN